MRILHPRPVAGRQRFIGVEFHDGVAVVDELHPERRLALELHGYTIDDELEAPIIDLTKLKLIDLRDLASKAGIEVPEKARKQDLIDLLAALPLDPAVGHPAGEQLPAPVAITIDGELHFVSPGIEVTAAEMLELAGLDTAKHDLMTLSPDRSAVVQVETITPAGGEELISAAISAGAA